MKTNPIDIETVLPPALFGRLDTNAKGFLKRVYSGDLRRYQKRLKSIGFSGYNRILDAGCGFGQWSLALADLNSHVTGIDISLDRIEVASRIARYQKRKIDFRTASIDEIPYPLEHFDAIFCYSCIFFLDEEKVLSEFHRILKKRGRLYVCFNALGWYLFLIFSRGLHGDFFSLKEAIKTLWNQMRGLRKGSHIISRHRMNSLLQKTGFRVVSLQAEGGIQLNDQEETIDNFLPGRYWGIDAVLEVVAEKL